MLIDRVVLLVPMVGFIREISRMNKLKEKEYYIINRLNINFKEHGQEIYLTDMAENNGCQKT